MAADNRREGTIRLRATVGWGFSGPEASSVECPPLHPKPLSKLANKAVTAGSAPGRLLPLTPSSSTSWRLSSLLSRVPSGCEPPIPAANTPSKPRVRRPSNGRPGRTPPRTTSVPHPGAATESRPTGSCEALRPGSLQRGLSAGGF